MTSDNEESRRANLPFEWLLNFMKHILATFAYF